MAENGNYGIEINFYAGTVEFDRSIKSMDKAIKALKKDITALNSNLKFDKLNPTLLARKWQDYQEIIKATEVKLQNYKNELNKVYDDNHRIIKGKEEEWARLQGAISETKGELVKLKDIAEKLRLILENIGAYKFAAHMEDVGKKLDTASKSAQTLATNLAPLSLVAGAALGGATKAAIEFESAMAGVKKTVEETPTTSYEKLEKTFRAMAQEVPATASEIAAVAEMAGQLGIEADSIENFTRVMIDLGNATNLTATDGAKAVAQFFNIMGHTSKEVNELVDNFGAAVTALGNNSATTEEDIVYMAKALAAASHTIGLTDQEVLGLATSLASLGLSAERGGSAMSTVMRKIHTDVNMVTDAGEERLAAWGSLMGKTADEFRKAWNEDSVQVLHDIVLGLNQTEDAGKSLYEVLSDVDVSNIRQIDTISRLALGYDRFDEYMAMANEEWEKNTALTIEANRRYKTTESQLQILKNKLTDIGITLGETILPIINDLISKAKPMLDRINQSVAANGKLYVKLLAIASALSPILFGVAKLLKVGSTLAMAVSRYTKLAVEATTTFGKLAAIIGAGASGVGLIAGIAALTIGVTALAYAWIKAKDDVYQFSKSMDRLNESMEQTAEQSDQQYETQMHLAEGAMIYAKRIDELVDTLENGNLTEAGQLEIKERIKAAVDALNSSLGYTAYAFDEETGAIVRNGDAVKNTTDDYQKMIDEMRKTTWLEMHKQSLQDAMDTQIEAMEQMNKVADDYAKTIETLEKSSMDMGMTVEQFHQLKDLALNGGDLREFANELYNNAEFMSKYGGDYIQLQDEVLRIASEIDNAESDANAKMEYANELWSNANDLINEFYAVQGMTVDEFAVWSAARGSALDLEQQSITALEAEKALYEDMIAKAKEQGETESSRVEGWNARIQKIDEEIAKREEQDAQERTLVDAITDYINGKGDEQRSYAEEQNQIKDDALLAQDEAMADDSKTYFVNAIADAIKQINDMKIDDKHMNVYVDLLGAGVPYLNGGIAGSGGYQYERAAGNYRSGGYNSGNYNVTINSNVNVNGNVSALQAKQFAEQIVETVNNELGKRLRYA